MSEYDIIIFYIRYMLVDRVEGSYQMASGELLKYYNEGKPF